MNKVYFKFVAMQEARDFIKSLPLAAQMKIYYNIDKIAGGVRDNELFKKLGDTEIWEFRTLYNGVYYRLFAFWDRDTETYVVATHGLIKKTRKTPKSDIIRAETLRKEYFKNKNE